MTTLLARIEFRNSVFGRDGHKCVICGQPAADAHHIIERRLFHDEGYYLDNGASLCSECHIKAEQTLISPEQLRELIGAKVILPEHLYSDSQYDKWGNIVLPNGNRLRGELFDDESVQKILKDVLHLFTKHVKYPRSHHVPWSESLGKDDRMMDDTSRLFENEVVISVKLDGENTTMYNDHIHARSVDSKNHPSRNYVKSIWAGIAHDIADSWRICGENLFAKHSIHYKNLESYFYIFSIWNEKNMCLSWDETVEWAELYGLPTVPVLYRGSLAKIDLATLYQPQYDGNECEGYVIRVAKSFHYKDFRRCLGKFVRKGHVQSHGHWMQQQIIPNELKHD